MKITILITLILLSLIFSLPTSIQAQTLPQLSVHSDPIAPLIFNKPTGLEAYTEIPPWIIPGGWRSWLLTTGWSVVCSSPDNLPGPVTFQGSNCLRILEPILDKPWRRNYYGSFSSHILHPNSPEAVIVSINHGENKNEIVNNQKLQNTVNPQILVENCASGYVGSQYQDCWDAYHAFVGLSWVEYTAQSNWGQKTHTDLGPIVWPSDGYLSASGQKTSLGGVRHPSSIIYNGFLYVFYLDTSNNSQSGRGWGIKVARAPIPTIGIPQPQDFRVLSNGQFSQPSLPSGLTLNNIASFYNQPGGLSDCIIGCNHDVVRFSVAKINNTNYFLGVEEYNDPNWKIDLYISSDLIHWKNPANLISKDGDWNTGNLHYPIFLDKTGWNNTQIDSDEFYILGSTSQNALTNIVKVSVQLSTVPTTTTQTPTPTPKGTYLPRDIDRNGKVDIFDYNLLFSDFGKTGAPGFVASDINKDGKVNMVDYTLLVRNFGKST